MQFTRRDALKTASSGFGYLAFAALAHQQALAESANPLAAKKPHFKPRAKRVIFLAMRGAPSHVDTFDYKPDLAKVDGQNSKYGRSAKLWGSPWEFSQHGKSGLWISELFPHVAKHADDLCLLRGMHTDLPNHPQAQVQLHTGSFQFVRPSLGAWTLYGLGTQNTNLPGFVVLNAPTGVASHYASAFLPAVYQGSIIGRNSRQRGGGGRLRNRNGDDKVPNIANSKLNKNMQRTQVDFVQALNRDKLRRDQHQPAVEGVIESFELAFRMQDELPKLLDISGESKRTLEAYGIGGGPTDAFGKQCLLARRCVEAGVRFVEIPHQNWDHHRNISNDLPARCGEIDQPIGALLADLKQRNLLDDTLVIWAGEFGRTPHSQGADGRDHNNKGFTTWMAGGGVKGGFSYGATDPLGYEAAEDRMHIHDWHATILHLLGLDHTQLTFRYAGRDFRLTETEGDVAKAILA